MKYVFAFLLMVFLLGGCVSAPNSAANTASEEDGRLIIVASVFPQYDFIRQIAGDKVVLYMLISPGAEPHAFEPSPSDMIALNRADLIVYVGGDGEAWVDTILDSIDNPNQRRVALIDLVDAVYKELVEGMEDDHGEDYGYDDHDDDDDHNHDDELDEHVWTSPLNAISIVQQLAWILIELDPDNSEYYFENSMAFIQELRELDAAFAEVAASGVRSTVVFADRFPFRYLMDSYGIDYFAAFPGCSSETQASPATIAFLIDKVKADNIPIVFHVEFSSRSIANVVAQATGARLLELHSTHNVSHADFTGGVTYLDIMNRNLEQLREALN